MQSVGAKYETKTVAEISRRQPKAVYTVYVICRHIHLLVSGWMVCRLVICTQAGSPVHRIMSNGAKMRRDASCRLHDRTKQSH